MVYLNFISRHKITNYTLKKTRTPKNPIYFYFKVAMTTFSTDMIIFVCIYSLSPSFRGGVAIERFAITTKNGVS